jgi:alpha-methylacyl-CoA racemase
MAQGPLDGVKVLEFAGLGPAPFCGMLLSDLGADVVRVDRRGSGTDVLGQPPGSPHDVTARGRRSVALDLKSEAGLSACQKLADAADVLIEGFRPGVMERLGLGPEALLARNPKLVYGRMTGWGQTGPLAKTSGHDLNYISLSGVLHAIGPADRPVPPLNIAGDGGGALYLAFGVMAALVHARTSGRGQVVDCAMTDTSASLAAMFYGFHGAGLWQDQRGVNLLDGGAPFYDVYACADGGFLSVAPLEPQFYAVLLEKLGLEGHPRGREDWPRLREAIAARIATRTRDEWQAVFEGSEACVAPVLTMDEAHRHPHNQARRAFVEVAGVRQPAPAPRFSVTPGQIQGPPPMPGADTAQVLADWGLTSGEITAVS